MKKGIKLFFFFFILLSCSNNPEKPYDVVVIGDGTGAISASIQSARSGAKTLLITEMPWLGGMLTSAGVSATDGNHLLPVGLWGEFRGRLRKHYGGTDSLFTGWVSNTMFEPSVGADIWNQMALKEENLTILFETSYGEIMHDGKFWNIDLVKKAKSKVSGKILIDGTDLGDIAKSVGAEFDLGIDSKTESEESFGPDYHIDIVQDLTYCAVLENYGEDNSHLLKKPINYDASLFHCACQTNCDSAIHDCQKMLDYGKLPRGQYMINWPINGNDFYLNAALLEKNMRQAEYEKAKNFTKSFLYYIQNELGFSHLGLSAQFGSVDSLPFMPYHREGRRIKGIVRMNANHIINPYDFNLYRTGIAVGDYPLDHHHDKNPDAPKIEFPSIPSYNIPLGVLIPRNVNNFLIADKAISVTHNVNGTTRLQPVVIQIGQAAGLLAAMSTRYSTSPKDISIRRFQTELLNHNGYIMPYADVSPSSPFFMSIQRIGASGIMRGEGIPHAWANKTLFYPDSVATLKSVLSGFLSYDNRFSSFQVDSESFHDQFIELLQYAQSIGLINRNESFESIPNKNLTRLEVAVFLDKFIHPFEREIDHFGNFKD